jgi:hypothetical protein
MNWRLKMTANENDPLGKLFYTREIPEILADILEPLVRIEIDSQPPILRLTRLAKQLSSMNLILIYLLYCKVLLIKGWQITERARPQEIETALEIPGNTIRPMIQRLKDQGLVEHFGHRVHIPDGKLTIIGKRLRDATRKVQAEFDSVDSLNGRK